MKRFGIVSVAFIALTLHAAAQDEPDDIAPKQGAKAVTTSVDREGPRFGVNLLTDDLKEGMELQKRVPMLMLVGWHFETTIAGEEDAPVVAVFEQLPFVAGLEQGKFIGILTLLAGMRTRRGLEIGVGPTFIFEQPTEFDAVIDGHQVRLKTAEKELTTAITFAFGYSVEVGGLQMAFNYAVTPSLEPNRKGSRNTLTAGMNW